MNDPIKHPNHYASRYAVKPIECQTIRQWLPPNISDAFKYIWRAGSKDDVNKDLDKALMYLDFYYAHENIVGRPAEGTLVSRALWRLLEAPGEDAPEAEKRRYFILQRLVYGQVRGLDEDIEELRDLLTVDSVADRKDAKGVTELGEVVEGGKVRLGDVDYIVQKNATIGKVLIAVDKYE